MQENKTFKQLLQQSIKSKDTEEWLDTYFTRPIGLAFALLWNRFGIHPNTITILSIFLGVISGYMFYHTDIYYNICGVLLLMFANFCDSTDGQLARLTGKKTLVGRVLDGIAGNFWFVAIYIALCLRLMPQNIPFTNYQWGWSIWIIAYIAGILSHSKQTILADYYRQIHLYLVNGDIGTELTSYRQQQDIYESLTKEDLLIKRMFYKNYAKYCLKQERKTPEFQKLKEKILSKYRALNAMPNTIKSQLIEGSRPLMKYTNILSFNTRAITLYISALLNIPWVYMFFEIIILNAIYVYMHKTHENMSKQILKQL